MVERREMRKPGMTLIRPKLAVGPLDVAKPSFSDGTVHFLPCPKGTKGQRGNGASGEGRAAGVASQDLSFHCERTQRSDDCVLSTGRSPIPRTVAVVVAITVLPVGYSTAGRGGATAVEKGDGR
ncbi:unnamed protein product [Calypogeia fissa]